MSFEICVQWIFTNSAYPFFLLRGIAFGIDAWMGRIWHDCDVLSLVLPSGNHGTISTHCNCATRKTARREVIESKQMMYAEGFLSCFWRTYIGVRVKITPKKTLKELTKWNKRTHLVGPLKTISSAARGPLLQNRTWPGSMEIAVEPLTTAVGFVHQGITQSVEPTWWESWW